MADQDDHRKRVRYYQSNIDISYLDKGRKYEELPEVYLIYMTKFELFKLGQTKYTIHRSIAGTDVVLDNGVHEQQFPELSDRIQYLKEDREGVTRMCEAMRQYGDERQSKGVQQGQLQERMETIREALDMKMPLGNIAKLVRLPVEEVRKLIAEIEQ